MDIAVIIFVLIIIMMIIAIVIHFIIIRIIDIIVTNIIVIYIEICYNWLTRIAYRLLALTQAIKLLFWALSQGRSRPAADWW